MHREGTDTATVERGLDELHATLTTFTDGDVEMLEADDLIFEPEIERLPVTRPRYSDLRQDLQHLIRHRTASRQRGIVSRRSVLDSRQRD